jgi:hypothetical protein
MHHSDVRGSIFGIAQLPETLAAGPPPGSVLYDDLDVPPEAGQALN